MHPPIMSSTGAVMGSLMPHAFGRDIAPLPWSETQSDTTLDMASISQKDGPGLSYVLDRLKAAEALASVTAEIPEPAFSPLDSEASNLPTPPETNDHTDAAQAAELAPATTTSAQNFSEKVLLCLPTEFASRLLTTALQTLGKSDTQHDKSKTPSSGADMQRQRVMLRRAESNPEPLSAQHIGQHAFAKIEFDDGQYFLQTMAVEFGRDQLAMKTAEDKLAHRHLMSGGHPATSSSSQPSADANDPPRVMGSQVIGSVVSEKGGFCGVDEDLPEMDPETQADVGIIANLSHESSSSVVNPADLHARLEPEFDYEANAKANEAFEQGDDEQPAQVTTAHLPSDIYVSPLIPIHARTRTLEEEIQSHKSISRRHIRIEWSPEHDQWMLHVNGRNGAFLNGKFIPPDTYHPLKNGSQIAVREVEMYFRLPDIRDSPSSESSDEDDVARPLKKTRANSDTSDETHRKSVRGKTGASSHLRDGGPEEDLPMSESQPTIPKKRGPGRPPKDGISSNRQKKEEARRQREAQAKAENGGTTPPPHARTKISHSAPKTAANNSDQRSGQSTKRKRSGDDILPSVEGPDDNDNGGDEEENPRLPKRDKSPSPDYGEKESFTAEELQKPSEPYAQQLYSLLLDIHPLELGLRQIYRAMKLRWPYYKHVVESNGWESSVRHNLNNHQGTSFLKGKKEAKGFYWSARPGFPPKNEGEKKRQAPQPQPRPRADHMARVQGQQGMTPAQWNTQYVPQLPVGLNGQMQHGQQAFFAPPGQSWLANGQMQPQTPFGNGSRPPTGPNGQPAGNGNQPFSGRPFPPAANITNNEAQPRVDATSHRPTSQPSQNQPTSGESAGQVRTATAAYAGMPCSVKGLDTIERFKQEMDKLSNPDERERAQYAIAVARTRLLHNASQPMKPAGLTPTQDYAVDMLLKDIDVMYGHVADIIDANKNPNFVGFNVPPHPPVVLPPEVLDLAVRSFGGDASDDEDESDAERSGASAGGDGAETAADGEAEP